MRPASGNVSLAVEDLTDLKLSMERIILAKIDALDSFFSAVLRVRLRLPPATKFDLVPGQYMEVLGASGVRRSYSLAKRAEGGALELNIRRVAGDAMRKYCFVIGKINNLLCIDGPRSRFTLQSNIRYGCDLPRDRHGDRPRESDA